MVQITEKPLYTVPTILEKVILTVMKQLKELQNKPRKNSEASTGFEPVTSTIPVQCSTITELLSLGGSRSRLNSIYTCYMKRVRCV